MSSARGIATVSRPVAVQAGDFNGDGRTDLAVVSGTSQGLKIYSGLFFAPPYTINVTTVADSALLGTHMARPADLDGDGRLDLVVSHSAGVSTYLGNGDGSFRLGGIAGSGNRTQAATVADINGDHIPDVASIEGVTNGRLVIALGRGDGSFVPAGCP